MPSPVSTSLSSATERAVPRPSFVTPPKTRPCSAARHPFSIQPYPSSSTPLDGRRFLFANLVENKYFTYHIPFNNAETGRDTCSPVSVGMHFSQCGRYLHVARVTARKATAANAATGLFIQVLTVELAARNPSGLPRTLARRHGIALGKWPSTAIPRLPFVLTWMDRDIYVSLSAELLKVFKITGARA